MFNRLFKRRQPQGPVFPGESFSISKLSFENGWGLASINMAYNNYPNKALYPWYALINIHVEQVNENGHPIDSEFEVLAQIEHAVTGFLQKNRTVHFIGRVTRPQEQDLLFYMDHRKFDPEATKSFFDAINAVRPLNFVVEKDRNWQLVQAFLS